MQATDRRTFLTWLSLGFSGFPGAATAQPAAKVYRIGYLSGASEPAQRASREAFLRALAEHGWVEGRNLAVEYRFADGVVEALTPLAAEIARARVDVIVTNLARPGGNVTGVAGDLTVLEKRLEALRDVTPKATRYGVLVNPDNR